MSRQWVSAESVSWEWSHGRLSLVDEAEREVAVAHRRTDKEDAGDRRRLVVIRQHRSAAEAPLRLLRGVGRVTWP